MPLGQAFIRDRREERNRLPVQCGVLQPGHKRVALCVLSAAAAGSPRRSSAQWENIYFRQAILPSFFATFAVQSTYLTHMSVLHRGCAQWRIRPVVVLLWPRHGCLGPQTGHEHETSHPHSGRDERSLVRYWRESFERCLIVCLFSLCFLFCFVLICPSSICIAWSLLRVFLLDNHR